MRNLVSNIAELRAKATVLKTLVAETQGERGARLREAQYHLEAAIYVMERNAADPTETMSPLGQTERQQAAADRAGVAGYQHFSEHAR